MKRRDLLRYGLGLSAVAFTPFGGPMAAAGMCSPTEPDVKGPFYLPGAPQRTVLAAPEEPGERILIRGRTLAADCQAPLAGALLDVWQADAKGHYHDENKNYRLRGRMKTNDQGVYEFSSIRPGRYQLEGGFRPAHIHFTVSHPDCEPLTTQLYFKGDPYLAPNDACGDACESDDPNRIIELTPVGKGSKVWFEGQFDIVLKPAGSTPYREACSTGVDGGKGRSERAASLRRDR